MVLFDENPVHIMSEATSRFHIAPDRQSITRIQTSLHDLATCRQNKINAQLTTLSALSRRLNNLKGQYSYEEERHDAGKHAAEMLKMDTEKFRIAKGVNDAEIESERLSGELAALKQQLETLEKEGVEGGARGGRNEEQQDANVLNLSFFRGLGVDVSQDPTTGEYNRAVVRNTSRGDVNVINVDRTMGQTFYANMFWNSM